MTDKQTEKHLKKLADAFFKYLDIDDLCYGGIGIDGKRPFGFSHGIDSQICEIIGLKMEGEDDYSNEQAEYAHDLYHEKLIPYLQKRWKEMNQ